MAASRGVCRDLRHFSNQAASVTIASGTARAAKASSVSDIGQALKAGQTTPQAAIERVVERVVARQAGANAPAAVKQQLATVLRQALEDDPMLAAKVRALGGPDSE